MASTRKTLKPADEVLKDPPIYKSTQIQAPRLTGIPLKLFVWLLESRLLGRLLYSLVVSLNGIGKIFEGSRVPESPMFLPEFPVDIPAEKDVLQLDERTPPEQRVDHVTECLPRITHDEYSFRFWSIQDYAAAYRSKRTTPSEVCERFITAVEESQRLSPPMSYFVLMDKNDLRKQAAASTERFEKGKPLSILDGIFVAVKDDIDCMPYPSNGGSVWVGKVRAVTSDAVSVARLRQCGVIFPGKANMHEIGMGVTGNNPFYGTARNPYNVQHYTGGSSAGPAALVASGLCPAAIGTDVGGSIRIPSSLCGVVGLKSTLGRISLRGGLEMGWSMLCIGPIAANVEDLMLIYAAMLGSHEGDVVYSKPLPPSIPLLERTDALGSLTLGKYSTWFYDTLDKEVTAVCDRALDLLGSNHDVKTVEIMLPELEDLLAVHLVTVGSEVMTFLRTYYETVKNRISYDVRVSLGLFKNFPGDYYVAAQCFRRRQMYYHLEALKSVDVIVTPTTPMTAPFIQNDSLKIGESDFVKNGNLMRFVRNGNFLGLPCLSVPVGYDSKGLPVGLQLIGRPWQEATLLRLGFAIQELLSSSRKRPSIFFEMLP